MNRKLYTKMDSEISCLDFDREKNVKMSLEYFLLEDNYKEDEKSNKEYKTFGVEIIKKEFFKEKLVGEEQKSAKHISINKENVENLLQNLSKNTVTPMTLHNILDDLIGVSC